MKTVVGVFFGGKSVEHEVSIISALQVMAALNKEKYEVVPIYISKDTKFYYLDKLMEIENYKDLDQLITQATEVYFLKEHHQMGVYNATSLFRKKIVGIDVAFPVVHGVNVEDGTLQGFLEMYQIPYVGSQVGSSAIGMDKIAFKKVLEASSFPVIEYMEVSRNDFEKDSKDILQKLEDKLGFPVILKPYNLGSSVGIEVVKEEKEFLVKMEQVFLFTDKILIERCVTNLREINCSVMGNATKQEASILEEPIKADEILSFKDKYMSNGKGGMKNSKSSGMASLLRKIPAELEKEQEEEITNLAIGVFKLLDCEGVSRIDFIIDVDQNKIYVNEINTIPGSLAFYLWEKKGISFENLCDQLISLAIKRQDRRKNIIYSHDVNILNMTGKK